MYSIRKVRLLSSRYPAQFSILCHLCTASRDIQAMKIIIPVTARFAGLRGSGQGRRCLGIGLHLHHRRPLIIKYICSRHTGQRPVRKQVASVAGVALSFRVLTRQPDSNCSPRPRRHQLDRTRSRHSVASKPKAEVRFIVQTE